MPFPFRHQRIRGAQAKAIAVAHEAGVTAPELARQYGVTRRTIFRVIARAGAPVVAVQVADWQAEFALTDEGPVQIDQWRPAS